MNPNPMLDKQLQAALLKLDEYSAYAAIEARGRLFIWRIWAIAGWVVAIIMMILAIR